MMHIDYVVELFINESEFLKLVDSIGNEKLSSIATTVRASANNKYAKVTAKQKFALATGLLDQYKTARAVYAAAFGVTEATMFGVPDPIDISNTEKI